MVTDGHIQEIDDTGMRDAVGFGLVACGFVAFLLVDVGSGAADPGYCLAEGFEGGFSLL